MRDLEIAAMDFGDYVRVGDWVRDVRMDIGVTQESLGEMLGLSRSVVANWERDEYVPGADSCRALAELFDVPVDDVLALVERSRGKRQAIRAPKGGYGAYSFKVLVGGPMVAQEGVGCEKCGRKEECRQMVGNGLPLLCEVWDVHDVYIAEANGLGDVAWAVVGQGEGCYEA